MFLIDDSLFRSAKLRLVIDPMHGSGREYLDFLYQDLGCRVEEVRANRDVLFGGVAPDPAESNLSELKGIDAIAESLLLIETRLKKR